MLYSMKKCHRITAVKQFGLSKVFFLIFVFVLCWYSYAEKNQGTQVKHYNEISYEKDKAQGQMLGEHAVVLDENGKLLPWTSYDNIINWSMNFIKNCPTESTKLGDDPWYLITSVFNDDCTFRRNQNNMGSNIYWAVETLKKYYAYSGDREPFYAVKLLLDRVIDYHTPWDWAWPNVPRTSDDSPDGEYTDNWAGVDKMCMAAVGYLNFYKLTGEKKYLNAAMGVADTVARHITEGDERHSPVPFRVDLRTGKVLDPYTANMVYVVMLLEELARMDGNIEGRIYYGGGGIFKQKRRILWKWIFDYPMKNNMWSGYYEDVGLNRECDPKGYENDLNSGYYNLNQQIPMETARYILQNPKIDRYYKEHIPALIKWVENRFGETKHYGATSIREQDQCFSEMGSHTARYASVVAKWFGVTEDLKDREEARAAFALATYSAYNRYSKNGIAVNGVGLKYKSSWFSDSYFDYMSHFFDGMAEIPEMAPENENHIIGSDSTLRWIRYLPKYIEYKTYEPYGKEVLKLTFEPEIYASGSLLDKSRWTFGRYKGVSNVLQIKRKDIKHILIKDKSYLYKQKSSN